MLPVRPDQGPEEAAPPQSSSISNTPRVARRLFEAAAASHPSEEAGRLTVSGSGGPVAPRVTQLANHPSLGTGRLSVGGPGGRVAPRLAQRAGMLAVNGPESIAHSLRLAAWRGLYDQVRTLCASPLIDEEARTAALKSAARAGHCEIVAYFIESGSVSEELKTSVTEAVAARGYIEIVRYLCPADQEGEDGLHTVALMNAAKRGHQDIIDYLCTNLSIHANLREEALVSAAKGGHLETMRYLLSKSEEVHVPAVRLPARSGRPRVGGLWSNESQSREHLLERALKAAANNGHLPIVHNLLSESPATVDQELFKKLEQVALTCAAMEGHSHILRYLLANEEVSPESCSIALERAIQSNQLECTRQLLNRATNLSRYQLLGAMSRAAYNGQFEIVRALCERGQTPPATRGSSVGQAAEAGHLNIVRYLLSDSEALPTFDRGSAVIRAAEAGHADIVEALLRNGPIYPGSRDSARSNASGPQRDRIRAILTSAPLDHSVFGGFSMHVGQADDSSENRELPLIFTDVEENPGRFLETIMKEGLPQRVRLEASPEAVDLGGIFQQFLTQLMAACCKKELFKINNGMPAVWKEEDCGPLLALASLFAQLKERNADRSDPFVLGELFDVNFYSLLKLIAQGHSDEILLQETIKRVSDYKLATSVLNNPEDEEAVRSFREEMMLDNEDTIESARDLFRPYLRAAQIFYFRLSEELKEQLMFNRSSAICDQFQGRPCSKEALLESLAIEDVQEESFMQKVQWLQEKIRSSDLEWRRCFVFLVTGTKVLVPGVSIEIRRGVHEAGYEAHTCFKSLHLPTMELEEKAFLDGLAFTMEKCGYNTA